MQDCGETSQKSERLLPYMRKVPATGFRAREPLICFHVPVVRVGREVLGIRRGWNKLCSVQGETTSPLRPLDNPRGNSCCHLPHVIFNKCLALLLHADAMLSYGLMFIEF